MAKAATNGKHATNGTATKVLPTCSTCGREMTAMAGGSWHRCFKCRPGGKRKPAITETPAAPAGQERRAEADPPNPTPSHTQAEAAAIAPAAGDSEDDVDAFREAFRDAACTARDLSVLGRFSQPDLDEDLDAELRAFRALVGLPAMSRRRVLAFVNVASEATR